MTFPEIMDAAQAADFLGISKDMVYKLTYQERIPFFRIGTLKRFRKSALLDWAENGGTVERRLRSVR